MMNNKLGAFAMLFAMASMGNARVSKKREFGYLSEQEKERLKKLAEKRRIQILKQKGIKEFWYGEDVIYALNQENADRKAKNKGLI